MGEVVMSLDQIDDSSSLRNNNGVTNSVHLGALQHLGKLHWDDTDGFLIYRSSIMETMWFRTCYILS